MGEYRLRIDTTRDRAVEFLSRLADDDDFRQQLAEDPRRVLYDYGVELPDELIPAFVDLPEKGDVQQLISGDLAAMGSMQAGPAMFFPVFVFFFAFPFLAAE
jgi:hypothetical protein